jgi:hypothetical protein
MNTVADLATSPSEVTIATYEGPVTIAVNMTARLASGQTSPISPSTLLLLNNGSGDLVTLVDSPTVSGANVLQTLRGTEVEAGMDYLLIVTFGDGAGNTQSTFTVIAVPI